MNGLGIRESPSQGANFPLNRQKPGASLTARQGCSISTERNPYQEFSVHHVRRLAMRCELLRWTSLVLGGVTALGKVPM
jgi:hypothetical protein